MSIDFILLDDKFNSLRDGKFTFAKTSIDVNWLEFKNKWVRDGKLHFDKISIDFNLFVDKSIAVNLLPNLLFAKESMFDISFSSKSNCSNLLNLIEHKILKPSLPIFLLYTSISGLSKPISVLYFLLKFSISLLIFQLDNLFIY